MFYQTYLFSMVKYLVVNSGYNNSVNPIVASANTSDVAFIHETHLVDDTYTINKTPLTQGGTFKKAFPKESSWMMPKLRQGRCGALDAALPVESEYPPQLKVYDCSTHHLKIINNTIPDGINFGMVAFRFENSDIEGLKYALEDVNKVPYKSMTVIDID
jgi:hypothetical protein